MSPLHSHSSSSSSYSSSNSAESSSPEKWSYPLQFKEKLFIEETPASSISTPIATKVDETVSNSEQNVDDNLAEVDDDAEKDHEEKLEIDEKCSQFNTTQASVSADDADLSVTHMTSSGYGSSARPDESSDANNAHATNSVDLYCKICSKLFDNMHRLQRHMLSHDSNPDLRKFRCDFCEKAFKFKHHLKVS